jgi:GTP cyclohydrolase III
MIKRGWAKCGLLRSFDRAFQAEAMEANSESSFFVGGDNICEDLQEFEEDWDDLFDDVDVFEMIEKLTM